MKNKKKSKVRASQLHDVACAVRAGVKRYAQPVLSGFLALTMLIGSVPAPAYAEMMDEATRSLALMARGHEDAVEGEPAVEPLAGRAAGGEASEAPTSEATPEQIADERDSASQEAPAPESTAQQVPDAQTTAPVEPAPAPAGQDAPAPADPAAPAEEAPAAIFISNDGLKAATLSGGALASRPAAVSLLKDAGASDEEARDAASAVFDAKLQRKTSAADSCIQNIAVSWITKGDEVSPDDPDRIVLHPQDNGAINFRMRVSYVLSGDHDYAPGDVTITVPWNIFVDRSGEPTGAFDLSIPAEPATNAGWNYRTFVRDGHRFCQITNTQRLAAATQGFMEFGINEVRPMSQQDLRPSAPFNATIEVFTGLNDLASKASNDISAVFDTYAKLNGAEKMAYSEPVYKPAYDQQVAIAHKAFPDASGFIVVNWHMGAPANGNQPSFLTMKDELSDTYQHVILNSHATNKGAALESVFNVTEYFNRVGIADIKVAYPIEQFELGKTYTFKNKVTYSMRECDKTLDGQEKPLQTKGAEGTKAWTYHAPKFVAPYEHYNLYYYGNDNKPFPDGAAFTTHEASTGAERSDLACDNVAGYDGYYGLYAHALKDIKGGKDVAASYTLNPVAYVMPYTYKAPTAVEDGNPEGIVENYGKKDVTLTVEQRRLKVGGKALVAGKDFDYTSVTFPEMPSIMKAEGVNMNPDGTVNPESGKSGTIKYANDEDVTHIPVLELQVRTRGNDAWRRHAQVSWQTGELVVAYADGTMNQNPEVALPADTLSFRIVSTSPAAALKYHARANITFRAAGALKQMALDAFENSAAPQVIVESDAILKGSSETGHSFSKDKMSLNRFMGHSNAVRATMSNVVRKFENTDVDGANSRVKVMYTSEVAKKSLVTDRLAYEEGIVSGDLLPERVGTWYDLLPLGMTPDLESVRLRDGDRILSMNTIENYRGTGRTMLVVRAALTPITTSYFEDSVRFYQDVLRITFNAWYDFADITDYGDTFHNVAIYQSDNTEIGTVDGYRGEPDNPRSNNNNGTKMAFEGEDGSVLDALTDLDGAGDERNNTLYAGSTGSVDPLEHGHAGLMKEVSANGDGDWGTDETGAKMVYGGGEYVYRLGVRTVDAMQMKNIVLYDSLESYVPADGAEGHGKGSWRGVLSGIDLSQLEARGCAPVLYCSTVESAPGAGLEIAKGGSDSEVENVAVTDLHNADIWKAITPAQLNALPRTERAKITAIAIDASASADGGAFELKAGSSIAALVRMEAPSGGDAAALIESGALACNNSYMKSESKGSQGAAWSDAAFVRSGYTIVGIKPFELPVEKVWLDDGDRDRVRPNDVMVQLVANGQDVPGKQLVLNKDNGWKGAFTGVAYADETGQKILYTVREIAVPEGYRARVKFNGTRFVLENERESLRTSVSGVKTWEGDNDGVRPHSIVVNLLANGEQVARQMVYPNADGVWSYTFRDVFLNEDGAPITYTVSESLSSANDYVASYDGMNITNTYHPYGDLLVTKKIKGDLTPAASNKDFTFTFTLENNWHAPLYDTFDYEVTGTGIPDGKPIAGTVMNQGTVSIKAGQTLRIKNLPTGARYSVREVNLPNGFCVANGQDTQRGSITPNKDNAVTFVNTYASEGYVQLEAQKVLNGWELWPRRFSIELLDGGNEVLRVARNGRGGDIAYDAEGNKVQSANVIFGGLHYTQESDGRTYTYTMRERQQNGDGITCSTVTYTVAVTPHDMGDGTMTADVQYAAADGTLLAPNEKPVFENVYRSQGTVPVRVHKKLKGGELQAGQFAFDLDEVVANEDGTTKLVEVQHGVMNSANGMVAFDPLAFDQRDAGATHIYAVHEVNAGVTGMTYDDHYALLKVVVSDNGLGKLGFNVTFDGVSCPCFVCGGDGSLNGAACTACSEGTMTSATKDLTFTNAWKPVGLDVEKTLAPGSGAEDPHHVFEFEMELVNEKGEPVDNLDFESATLEAIDGSALADRSERTNGDTAPQENAVATPQGTASETHQTDQGDSPAVSTIGSKLLDALGSLFAPEAAYAAEPAPVIEGNVDDWWWKYDPNTGEMLVGGQRIYNRLIGGPKFPQEVFSATSIRFAEGSTTGGELLQFFNGFRAVTKVDMRQCDMDATFRTEMMFDGCWSLTEVLWPEVRRASFGNMAYMFRDCKSLVTLDLTKINMGTAHDMTHMFDGCKNLKNLDLSNVGFWSAKDTSGMFGGCESLTSLDLSNFETKKIKECRAMFAGCKRLETIKVDPKKFTFDRAEYMQNMFSGCEALNSIDTSEFTGSYVKKAYNMFSGCKKLEEIALNKFSMFYVDDMGSMFSGCTNLKKVDLSSYMSRSLSVPPRNIFDGCPNLRDLKVSGDFRFVKGVLYPPSNPYGMRWIETELDGSRMSGKKPFAVNDFYDQPDGYSRRYKWNTWATVEYDANQGIGSAAPEDIDWSQDVVLRPPVVTRPGYAFKGWKIGSTILMPGVDGVIAIKQADAQELFIKDSDGVVPCVAQWEKEKIVTEVRKGVYRFKVPAGHVLHLPDVIPSGTGYTVRELDEAGYKLVESSDTVGIVTAGASEVSRAAFVNAELAPGEAQPACAEIRVAKMLDGRAASATDGFHFKMTGYDPATGSADGSWTAAVADGGTVAFPALSFDGGDLGGEQARTFEYRIVEVAGDDAAIEYDGSTFTAAVTLIGSADGSLSTKVAYTKGGKPVERPVFENATKPASLCISKDVEGATAPSEAFTFHMTLDGLPYEGAYTVDGKKLQSKDGIVKVPGGKTAVIEGLSAGGAYTVDEVGIPAGWSLASAVGATGTLSAGVQSAATFTNRYVVSAPATAQLAAWKSFPCGGLADGMFAFDLYEGPSIDPVKLVGSAVNGPVDAADEVPGPGGAPVANPHKGMAPVYFPELSFEAPGEYEYAIVERDLGAPGTVFDASIFRATVTVVDNGDGTLSSSVVYLDGGGTPLDDAPVFVNAPKSVGFSLTKVVTTDLPAGSPARDVVFTFDMVLKDAQGDPLLKQVYRVLGVDGSLGKSLEISDGGSLQLRAGESALFEHLPYGAFYGVSERPLPGWNIDAQACEGEAAGTLTSLDAPTAVVVANTYAAEGSIAISGMKRYDGVLHDDQFAFDLVEVRPGGVREVVTTSKNRADGSIDFGEIRYTLQDVGSRFTYEAMERNQGESGTAYDNAVYSIEVTPRDNGDGTIACDCTIMRDGERVDAIVFTNSRAVELPFTGGSGVGAMGVLVIAMGCMAYPFDRKRKTRSV